MLGGGVRARLSLERRRVDRDWSCGGFGSTMSEREDKIRVVVTTYFPMFIAALSLFTAIYNGYLNNRFVDLVQNNIARVEYLRTCKEIIDAYFQVKFRVGMLAGAGGSAGLVPEQVEAMNAVNKFGALGTYLANLRNDAVRARYTELSVMLEKIIVEARQTSRADLDRLFQPAERLFAEMNDDCVRSAKTASPLQ
jgi:hypothetical protein